MKYLISLTLLMIYSHTSGQTYNDYYGHGHDIGISVNTSNSQEEGQNTINGTGRFTDLAGSSRFTAQSTFGADMELIEYVQNIGIDAWLEEQFLAIDSTHFEKLDANWHRIRNATMELYGDTAFPYWGNDFKDTAFWEKVLFGEDQLRLRVTNALSQILVVSEESLLDAHGYVSYYDILYTNAFGNYRDILYEVTMNPIMAVYLSYFQNPKTDTINNVRPDENYARELMQLFTIGTIELNNDGTPKLDQDGNFIPTYTNEHITELAKVFTGLHPSAWDTRKYPLLTAENFHPFSEPSQYDLSVPLTMHDTLHNEGPKLLLDGTYIPDGQTGLEDIEDAIDHLFNHPNVGPFIGYRLIQRLVKSNPSPAYVNRVASAFNNNGEGIRGDMQAVIRAILTDPEARDCEWLEVESTGKLREPNIRFSHLLRAFNVYNESGNFLIEDNNHKRNLEQSFLHAPSVFNFYTPFYAPSGEVSDNELVAPEFQILNSATSINYLNDLENWINHNLLYNRPSVDTSFVWEFYEDGAIIAYPNQQTYDKDECHLDLSQEINILTQEGADALLDRLNLLLCHGTMTSNTHTTIVDALNNLAEPTNGISINNEELVNIALYYVLLSPDYTILK